MPSVLALLGLICLLLCCLTTTDAVTKNGTFSCVGQPLDVYVPDYDLSACREFFMCARDEIGSGSTKDSVLVLKFKCPVGQAFDTRINDCLNASDVICDKKLALPTTRTARKVNNTLSENLQLSGSEHKTNFKCSGRKLGLYYSDPETNCTTFHLCTRGEAQNEILNFKFKCLHGEVFDDTEQTCVSYKSDCSSFVSPSTTTTTTTTAATTTAETTTTTTTTTTTSTTTTPSTPIEEINLDEYVYDTSNVTDYEYYDIPQNQQNRKRRSPAINVQNVGDFVIEGDHNIYRRQVSHESADHWPPSSFTCEGKVPGGHYADTETGCRVYHVCSPGPHGTIQDFRYLCSNGTIFSQQTQACEDNWTVDCSSTPLFFSLNEELSRVEPQVGTTADQNQLQPIELNSFFQQNQPQALPENTGGRTRSRNGRRKGKGRRRRPTTTTPAALIQAAEPVSIFDQPPITIIDPLPRPIQHISRPIQQTSTPIQQTSRPIQQTSRPIQEASRHIQEASRPVQEARRPVQHVSRPIQQTSTPIQTSQQQISRLTTQTDPSPLPNISPLHATTGPTVPLSQTSSFDAFIQAAFRQEQEQRTSLGPIIAQRNRQQEAEGQQRLRQKQIDEEQERLRIQLQVAEQERHKQQQMIEQQQMRQQEAEAEQQRILQEQEEQRRFQVDGQLTTQFQQAPVRTPQRGQKRRKRPRTTTPAPFQQDVALLGNAQDLELFQISTTTPTSTIVQHAPSVPTLPQPLGPIETSLPTLPTLPPFSNTVHSARNQPNQADLLLRSEQRNVPAFETLGAPTLQQTSRTQSSQTNLIKAHHDLTQQFHQLISQSTTTQSPTQSASHQLFQSNIPQFPIPQTPEAVQTRNTHFQRILPQIPVLPTHFPIPQQFPTTPAPSVISPQSTGFQSVGVAQPSFNNIQSIILQHLRNTQNLRSTANFIPQQPALATSPSRLPFSFVHPLGVQSRLVQYQTPTSTGFEITTGGASPTLGRFVRQVQDIKRFKPIAVKIAENRRQQQEEQRRQLQQSTFTCKGKVAGGYYADLTTGCQMFHICSQGRDESVVYDFRFVCANWTLFDQRSQTCSAEGKVKCHESSKYFPIKTFDEPEVSVPEVELLKIRIKRAVQVEGVVPNAHFNQIDFPSTSFSCENRQLNRYYADHETNCQMFHLCTESTTGYLADHRFLCKNGTVFDERAQACDDQIDSFNCIDDPTHYGIGEELKRQR
ncbi:hypothetical protein CHUAL_003909 [Chamberlinius hualienensis]